MTGERAATGVGDAPLQALLAHLCEHMQLPADARAQVLESASFALDDAVITLAYEEWSSFVKVFVNLGRPVDADAPRLHRYLLTQQLLQPAPFLLTAGLHPETEEVFLCGAVPMPTQGEAMEGFLDFLKGSAAVYAALHEEMPEDIVWA